MTSFDANSSRFYTPTQSPPLSRGTTVKDFSKKSPAKKKEKPKIVN